MEQVIILSTTTESKKDAEQLAKILLEEKLVACAQIHGPIDSHYRWQGDLTSSVEFCLEVKTCSSAIERVKEKIIANHPYELPELAGTVTDLVSEDYRAWVVEQIVIHKDQQSDNS
ncbi:divalent-cation tolerance protein CutA [Desulforhopalus singaporensis]|uniref:Divalent cation tolerance protein n=1 Tax=Desulforhopalus singaporensis TaxID=91360 RepID=A0A1H0QI59_9BACT|nr:divalent-cation tolerance protein CutA [Desulforhopalus singaporensis]SDP17012.1 divalent cation tolerance protein [Desulforhopalus singaporensis]